MEGGRVNGGVCVNVAGAQVGGGCAKGEDGCVKWVVVNTGGCANGVGCVNVGIGVHMGRVCKWGSVQMGRLCTRVLHTCVCLHVGACLHAWMCVWMCTSVSVHGCATVGFAHVGIALVCAPTGVQRWDLHTCLDVG